MILSKDDLKRYIKEDALVNHFGKFFRGYPIKNYLKTLRTAEYYTNKNNRLLSLVWRLKLKRLSVKLGISIGLNCFEEGLYIPHYGCIVVNSNARFGRYCVIQCGVNISDSVVAGNHVYLGAGAKVLTGVHIADDVIVGANAVVTKSINEPNTVWAGIPAKKLSDNGFASNRTFI